MKATDSPVIRIGAWRVDPTLDQISKDGDTVKLERRAMQLLLYLAGQAGRVVSVEELLDQVWAGVVVTPDSVYRAVASLRRSLGDESKEPTYIINVPRRGYRLVAPVVPWEPAPTTPIGNGPTAAEAVHTPPRPERSRAAWRGPAVVLAVALLAALGYLVIGKLRLSRTEPVGFTANTAALTPDKSIAVLPFLDMSENHDQEYFSDGLSEELIDLLANIPDLKVPARTSSFYFKGKATTIAEIARTLHVSHVLEGSVRKSGETIRVTAQLNRADTGYHLWSQTYERNIKDVFKVQDEIAAAVVEALKAKLAPTQPVFAHRSSNAQAYNEYLRGREFSKPGNLDGFRRAIEAYRKAIGFDANYAAAYAGLAESEALLADATGDAAALEQADADAAMAVALAPAEAVGYAARGWLRSAYSWDWAGAQADLAKALALDPANVEVQSRYASLLSYMGLLPQAVAAAKKAIDLDPLSSPDWGQLGRYLMLIGDFRASGEALRRALDIQPESIYGLNNRVTLLLREGKASEALATARKVDDDSLRLYGIALAEHALGHAREARAALDELIAKHAQEAAYQIAWVFAWRGETDDAIEWLERAYRQRDGGLAEVKVDPVFVRLRGDARYQALLKKMNFSE